PNGRIAEVLAGIDVLVVPSLWFENSPLTIHEAWLAGIPVLASDRGGMAELVDDGVNGLHFRLGDADDLRAKIRRLIDDRQLVRQLSNRPGVVKNIRDDAVDMEARYRRLVLGETP
ncbi:MAG: glycosyltransferase, partial [Planctomycetes bacterium]|nr:glycosyltransferase [Planctomycetota bacterium]